MNNLEITLLIACCILLILYIREKMKPKTEAEIQYQREKDKELQLVYLENAEKLKTLDYKIKALKKPVMYVSAFAKTEDGEIGMVFKDYSYNEAILSVKSGDGIVESFQINGKWGDIRKEAPFIASLLQDKIFNNIQKQENEVLF